MDKIIASIRKALSDKNHHAALFVALTLPDICAALEHGSATGARYAAWFETNLPDYKGFLSGRDCYALRCSLLHQGKDDISEQRIREVLEHYVFLESGAHCNLFADISINGEDLSFLQLNAAAFCEDLCRAAETWISSVSSNTDIRNRLKSTIKIHKPGYIYKGIIRFN